jgi:hypothetical protein
MEPQHFKKTARMMRKWRSTPRVYAVSAAARAMVIVAQRCIPDARERFRALMACGPAALFDPDAFDNVELDVQVQRRGVLYKLLYLAGAQANARAVQP